VNPVIRIRKAVKKDAPVIAAFNKAMAFETEKKELSNAVISKGVARLLSRPGYGFYLVAESEGSVVGSLMITYEWSDWRNGVFWWIQSVYVLPEYRRRGVFGTLFAYVKASARRRGGLVCGYRLYVDAQNQKAIKTYRKLGLDETHYKLFEIDLSHS